MYMGPCKPAHPLVLHQLCTAIITRNLKHGIFVAEVLANIRLMEGYDRRRFEFARVCCRAGRHAKSLSILLA